MAHGKHAREEKNYCKTAALATTGALSLAGIAGLAGSANAATNDQWERIAACESGDMYTPNSGRWNLSYGDSSSTGGLQIQGPTWRDYGGSAYAPAAYQATKAQQIAIAERILAGQGPGAWVCNNPGHGIASGALSGQSGNQDATPAPTPTPTPSPSPIGHKTHTVRAGDTLYGIAKANGQGSGADNWKALYRVNRKVIGANPGLIFPGQVFRVSPLIRAQPAQPSTPRPSPSPRAYSMPVNAPVGQSYGNPGGGYTLGYHTGTDFSASYGTPVKAVSNGTVVASDTSSSYGINIQIRNADGTYSLYAHLSARLTSVGQTVTAGQRVGNVGSTGTNSSGPHLHFEIRTSPRFAAGNFLNPVAWLQGKGVL